jgi:sulfotransferase
VKQYYFISGLPRSGSTLLSAILKQNPEFHADIASPVEGLTGCSIDIITGSENNFTVSEEQRKNLLYGIFDGYYQHIEHPIIFDSSRSWTKKTNLLQTLFPYTKILCPVRDIVSILNSFEVLLNKNCFHTKQINEKIFSDNIFVRFQEIFEREVIKYHTFLQEGYAINSEMIFFIEYENLCKKPEKTIREIYEFLEKPYYCHDFNNVEYSNEIYDIGCNVKNLHTVRKKVEYKPSRCVVPPEISQKYKKMNMEFWRKNNKMNSNIIGYK